VRDDLRTERARHQKQVTQIHTQKEDRGNAQDRVDRVLEQLGDSLKARPAAVDYLPSDPDVRR